MHAVCPHATDSIEDSHVQDLDRAQKRQAENRFLPPFRRIRFGRLRVLHVFSAVSQANINSVYLTKKFPIEDADSQCYCE